MHQLAPELAESMSATQCVIFLDAATAESDDMKAGQIRIEQIRCDKGSGASGFCHAFSPTNVLELAKQLYGASPQAYVVSVIGANFSHGESLSTTVESCLPEFIARIEGLIRECLGRTGDF